MYIDILYLITINWNYQIYNLSCLGILSKCATGVWRWTEPWCEATKPNTRPPSTRTSSRSLNSCRVSSARGSSQLTYRKGTLSICSALFQGLRPLRVRLRTPGELYVNIFFWESKYKQENGRRLYLLYFKKSWALKLICFLNVWSSHFIAVVNCHVYFV